MSRINDNDVAYIRADLVRMKELRSVVAELTHLFRAAHRERENTQ